MKPLLRFFTEEGRTRSRNALRRYIGGAIAASAFGCVVAVALYFCWVPRTLTPLQRAYFDAYQTSSWRSYLPGLKSKYSFLAATLTDPDTKKDLKIDLPEKYVEPVLDAEGQVTFDSRQRPVFRPKLHAKQFYWSEDIVRDDQAYNWFRSMIFAGQTVTDVCRPAWLGAIIISVLGAMVYPAFDMFSQRDYLRGDTIRGPLKVSPRAYARQHRKDTGYGITVYTTEVTRRLIAALLRVASVTGFAAPAYRLGVPRREENEGLLVLGDPGTGKSQSQIERHQPRPHTQSHATALLVPG